MRDARMALEPSKESQIIEELLRKLDAERQKVSRLESELSEYKAPDKMRIAYEAKLKEKDSIIKEQKSTISQQKATISQQKATINKLNWDIEWLKRKVWGQSSEKKFSYDEDTRQLTIDFGELNVSPEEEAAFNAAAKEARKLRDRRKADAAKRHSENKPSRKVLPDNLERKPVHFYPEGYIGHEGEWELLPDSFNEVTEVLEREPAKYYVRQIIRHKAIRKDNIDRSIEVAAMPVLPVAKSYGGASVLANLMIGKYADHIPFYRQLEMLKRLQVDIPPATLNGWFMDVADLLRPLYYKIQDMVLESDYIQADETTVPIINNEKHRTVKGYLWQVRAVMLGLMFFHYDKGSRSKDVALSLFAHFKGAMQTDGYAVYDIYDKKDGVLSLVCWAHARRYFDRALNNDKARAEYALEQIGLLYEIEKEADNRQLDYDGRRDLRLRLATPILKMFEAWLKNEYPKVMPKSPIGKAIHFALEHYDRLCRYVIDGRYKIDSNLVENGQRPVAVGRKGYLFCGNDDAAEDAAVMYTMMGCCKIAEVNVEQWLTYFLEHVHDYDNDYSRDLAELLPSELKRKGLIA